MTTLSDQLLRLATVVRNIAAVTPAISIGQYNDVKRIISDLEATPTPEMRTITREEFNNVVRGLASQGIQDSERHARAIAAAWRLAVETDPTSCTHNFTVGIGGACCIKCGTPWRIEP